MTAAGFVAVPETWKAGGRSFHAASEALAKAADRLCAELTAAGVAWGQGDLGRAFFNGSDGKPGFGATRNQWLPQIEDLVNVLAGTGDAMIASGARYAEAEQANTIGAPPVGGVPGTVAGGGSYRMPSFAGGMANNDPPPGELMQMLDLVESLVAGCAWPDGSTGGMGQIRDALSAMATVISEVIADVSRGTADVTASNSGQAAENFATFARLVVQGLEQLREACLGMSGSADNLRRQIDAARIQFVAGLVFLVGSFIAAQALSLFTFGGSEAAFMATAETEGLALRVLLQMLARAVIEGLWYGAGMDAIAQISRMITGLQSGFDVGELAKAGGEGALAGLVMGGLGAGARLGAGRSAVLDAVTRAMDSGGAKGLGARLAFTSATGFAGNVVSQAALNDGHVDWIQAGQFAVGMSFIGEGMERVAPGPARAAPGGTAGTDVPSAIDEARPPSAIQAALTTTHDHSPGDPAAAHADTAMPAGTAVPADAAVRAGTVTPADTAGPPGPAGAAPAVHLASVAHVADAPRADVLPADRAASGVAPAPPSHAPDSGPPVSVIAGPHADARVAADPAVAGLAAPADAAAVPADHVGAGSAGPVSAGESGHATPAVGDPVAQDVPAGRGAGGAVPDTHLAGAPARWADVTPTPAGPEHGSGDTADGRQFADGANQPGSRMDQLLGSSGQVAAADPMRPGDAGPTAGLRVHDPAGTGQDGRYASRTAGRLAGEPGTAAGHDTGGDPRPQHTPGAPDGTGGRGHGADGAGTRDGSSAGDLSNARSHSGADAGPGEQVDNRGPVTALRGGQDVSGPARVAVAEAGEAGRAAVKVLDAYGVGLEFSDGGGTYYDAAANVIHVDLSRQSEHFVSSVVHEAAYARWEHDGLGVPVTSRDRAAFIESNLRKEAGAGGDAETADLALRSRHPDLGLSQTERARVFASGSEETARSPDAGQPARAEGYDGGVRQAEASAKLKGQTLTEAERAAAGEVAGRQALREWYDSGRALAPTGESFRDYYGRMWDEHHTRAVLADAGPEGLRAQEALEKYNIKVEYSPGDGTTYTDWRSTLRIDPTDGRDPTASLVWGATTARWEKEKLGVPVSSPDREEYVKSQLLAAAEAGGDAEVAFQHLRSNNPNLGPPEYERGRVFTAGYHDALEKAQAAARLEGRTPGPGELARAGEAGGREALREWFLSGHAETMSGTLFRDIYGHKWDEFQTYVKDPNVRELFNAVEEGRDTADVTRRILAEAGDAGRAAQKTLDANDVKLEYSKGVSTYHDSSANKIHIGLENSHSIASSLAHEATHSEFSHEQRHADIQGPKDQYVHSALDEESTAEFNAVRAAKAYREAHPELDIPRDSIEKEFDRGYEEGVRKAEADAQREGRTLQPAERAAAGDAAARTAMYELYTRSRTSNTGELYPDYYGKIWDRHHAPSPKDLQQSLQDAVRDGQPTGSLTRRALKEVGPEGPEAQGILDRHNVTVTYSEAGSSYDAASNTVNINLSRDPGPELVNQAHRVRWALEGVTPDVATLGRDAYVDAKVRADSESTASWWNSFLHLRGTRFQRASLSPDVFREFAVVSDDAAKKAEIAAVLQGKTLTPGESAAAGDNAARDLLYEALRSGRLQQSSLEQYQREWDEFHKAQGADAPGNDQPPGGNPAAQARLVGGADLAGHAVHADPASHPADPGTAPAQDAAGPAAAALGPAADPAAAHLPAAQPESADGGFADRAAAGRPDPGPAFTPHEAFTPHAEVRFGLDPARPEKLDVSPGQEVLIGRGHESPLSPALRGFDRVSRRHLTIGADRNGTAWIRDEGSTNGTLVDRVRIRPGEKVPLPPGGATVRLGDQTEIHVSAGTSRAHDPGGVAHGEVRAAPAAREHPAPGRPDGPRPEARQAARRELGQNSVPPNLSHIIAEHSGLLDAPHSLDELKKTLGPGVSFDDMYALRALSYHLNGIEPPELSRESLDEFLNNIWNRRFTIKRSGDVYREYSSPSQAIEENRLTRPDKAYLNEVAGIAAGRKLSWSAGLIQGRGPRFLTAENVANVDPADVGFVHFHRDNASSNTVSQRVYVNARADSAPTLMHALVHEVVDDPDRFPGIYAAKIAGPHGGRQRADNIVIYTTDDAASQRVISWLKDYRQGHHDAFMWSVPAMTRQVMEGVSTGAEPPDGRSFGEIRADAIHKAMQQAMQHDYDFAKFHTLALAILRVSRVNPQVPHLNASWFI